MKVHGAIGEQEKKAFGLNTGFNGCYMDKKMMPELQDE